VSAINGLPPLVAFRAHSRAEVSIDRAISLTEIMRQDVYPLCNDVIHAKLLAIQEGRSQAGRLHHPAAPVLS
jgi:hypothetical protein